MLEIELQTDSHYCLSCGNKKDGMFKVTINRDKSGQNITSFHLCEMCLDKLAREFSIYTNTTSVKSVDIPTVKYVESDDGEKLYINGKLVTEHKTLYPGDILVVLEMNGYIRLDGEEG